MLFNSYQFILFFPIVTIGYFLIPHAFRWLWLLIASCIFYMSFIPEYILILGFTIIVDYIAGLLIEKGGKWKKVFLICSIVANVGVLAYFKYYNFFLDSVSQVLSLAGLAWAAPAFNIILPIGLSFHTFQAMAYTIEVYRGAQQAERHFGIYALYVMFYPQLVAGPIERPQNLLHQFKEVHRLTYDNVAAGLQLMLWGFFKKVVIADRLACLVNTIYQTPDQYSPIILLLATYAFTIQIYCDFSGYSDIARGAARIIGFDLMVNFRRPYFAFSIQDFWRRWHISLSTWFRDYIYVPLGGSRGSQSLLYRNLMIVFLVSGLWHGANWTYLVWGGLHGLYLIGTYSLQRYFAKAFPVNQVLMNGLGLVITFNVVAFAWIFFRATSLQDALLVSIKLLSLPQDVMAVCSNTQSLFFQLQEAQITNLDLALSIFFVASGLLVEGYQEFSMRFKHFSIPAPVRWLAYYAAGFCITFLGGTQQQFIYFQF